MCASACARFKHAKHTLQTYLSSTPALTFVQSRNPEILNFEDLGSVSFPQTHNPPCLHLKSVFLNHVVVQNVVSTMEFLGTWETFVRDIIEDQKCLILDPCLSLFHHEPALWSKFRQVSFLVVVSGASK